MFINGLVYYEYINYWFLEDGQYANPNVDVILKLILCLLTAGGERNHTKRGGRPNYPYSSRPERQPAYRLGLGGTSPSYTTPEDGKLLTQTTL